MNYYNDENAYIDNQYDFEFSLPPTKISKHAILR